jgi:hypothetical protein
VVKAARELRKDKGRGMVKSTEWSESDRLLMFCGKIYVPNDRDLRHCIVKQHHNTRITRHAGRFKTLYRIPQLLVVPDVPLHWRLCQDL